MARIVMDGLETGKPATTTNASYNSSMWYAQQFGSGALNASTLRSKSGNYSFRYDNSIGAWGANRHWPEFASPVAEHFGRVEIYNISSVEIRSFVFWRDEANNILAEICPEVVGDFVTLHFYVKGSLVGTAADAYSKQTWVRIEWRFKVDDDPNGVFEVKRNGDIIFSHTGDTKFADGTGMSKFYVGVASAGRQSYFIDDIAVNDTTGTVNNSWVGPGSILLLKPKGAGNYTQWTPDSGNNFARVNEIPHTSDTAYVESDTADEIDTYEMQTLTDLGVDTSDPSFNIKAVQYLVTGRWDEAETELSPVLRLGSTDEIATAIALSNTYYRYWGWMMDASPFDSQPWEVADLNNLEAGIKHIAASP